MNSMNGFKISIISIISIIYIHIYICTYLKYYLFHPIQIRFFALFQGKKNEQVVQAGIHR